MKVILTLFIVALIFNGLQAVFLNEDEGYNQLISLNQPNIEPIKKAPKATKQKLVSIFIGLATKTDPNSGASKVIGDLVGEPVADAAVDLHGAINAFKSFAGFVSFFFGGFVFKAVQLPIYMNIIVTPIYIILLLVFWYLVFDFMKDIEILGSSI